MHIEPRHIDTEAEGGPDPTRAPTVDARIYPRGGLDVLSRDEVARLREERYGYTLRQALAEDGLEMEESTLYPLLRRLEAKGMLVSEWREEDKRKMRFYRLSLQGEALLERLLEEWRAISRTLDKIIDPKPAS